MNLDVGDVRDVAVVLRNAADEYIFAAGQLEAAHEDPRAGRPWMQAASVLDSAASRLEKKVGRR
jgi:hypothetical protein